MEVRIGCYVGKRHGDTHSKVYYTVEGRLHGGPGWHALGRLDALLVFECPADAVRAAKGVREALA